jgi:hypothetical protein
MVRLMRTCPPGVVCLTPSVVLAGILLVAAVIAAIALGPWFKPSQLQYVMPQIQVQAESQPQPIINVETGDGRFTRAPKPERHWVTQPDLPSGAEIYGKLPRVPTRGIPETYQSMGIITLADGKILPLYGRRTASRSDRFQYYTRTDTYNPVQLPIRVRRRDCQDDIGCEELSNDDDVTIQSLGKGKTTIYRFDGPTYVPGII